MKKNLLKGLLKAAVTTAMVAMVFIGTGKEANAASLADLETFAASKAVETWVEVFSDGTPLTDSSAFDYIRYAADYPDLAAAFGQNGTALYNHYITCGKAEGRTAYYTDGTMVEEAAEIPPVPETDEWAVNLYQALLKDDYQTVLEIAPDPETVRENCAPYEDAGWAMWDYETAYRLQMSDGQVMGVILYEHEDGTWEIDSFVSYQEGDGFNYTGYGDHQVTLYSDGGYAYLQNGKDLISHCDFQRGFTMESEEEAYAIWHM